MQKSSAVLGAVSSLVAAVSGVSAYAVFAPAVPSAAPDAAVAGSQQEGATAGAPARTKVRYRPCAEGARLERGVCVTRVIRTVVVSTSPAPALPATEEAADLTPAGHETAGEPEDPESELPESADDAESDDGDEGDEEDHEDAEDHDGEGDDDGAEHEEDEDEDVDGPVDDGDD